MDTACFEPLETTNTWSSLAHASVMTVQPWKLGVAGFTWILRMCWLPRHRKRAADARSSKTSGRGYGPCLSSGFRI